MLVGQALATANLCSDCGETLRLKSCQMPEQYHEKTPTHGSGTVPVCCTCHQKADGACPEEERFVPSQDDEEEEQEQNDQPTATDD